MPSASAARTLAAELSMNNSSLGWSPDALKQDLVDARVRLDDADMAGNDAVVEFAQEIVIALRQREGFVGEVAERVDRLAGRAQSAQQRHVLLDRTAERLDPPLVEHPEFLRELGKVFGSRLERAGEIGDDVGMRDKVHAERSRQEALHAFLVVENLAVKIARIPAQQNVTDVKDDNHQRFLA